MINLCQGWTDWGDLDNDGDLDLLLMGVDQSSALNTVIYRSGDQIDPERSGNTRNHDRSGTGLSTYTIDNGKRTRRGKGTFQPAGLGQKGQMGFGGQTQNSADQGSSSRDRDVEFNEHQSLTGLMGKGKWGDLDSDGDMDLLIAGLKADGDYYSEIFLNDGGNLSSADAGLITVGSDCSIDFGDYDQDGDLDIFISGNYSTIAT